MMARILMAAYTNYRRDPRVRREAEALVDQGHEVTFLASRQPNEPARETVSGVLVRKLWGIRNPKTSALGYLADYGIFVSLLFVHCLIHARRYDLIHINNMPDFLVFGALVPRIFGTPVIHDVHDLMPELYMEKFGVDESNVMIRLLMLQERWAGRFATAVLTVEDGLRQTLIDRGIPGEKIKVLMNLPDDQIFSERRRPVPKGPDEAFVMVYHGTLARRLGLDVAIRALGLIRDRLGRVEFRIIGAGEERERLIELTNELGLEDTVSFSEGFVPVEQIPKMLSHADLGIVPLRPSSGTDIMLPTKLLEYVFMGIPSVVPKTNTVARYFDDRMVEFFEAGDPKSLSDSILNLYRNRVRREQMAQEASLRFSSKYRWSEHRKIYVSLVRDLMDD
jgi:glycosyltransferase involved in cell wall biosynthesis